MTVRTITARLLERSPQKVQLIQSSIHNPVKVAVGVIFIVMFGLIALFRIPVQLTPNVDKPQITVETRWRGASPQEVEREIIQEQEDQLKSVEGMKKMTSQCYNGRGRILMEFIVGTDIDSALLKVANKLDQVPEYPQEADEPVIRTVNTSDSPIAWFTLRALPGKKVNVRTLRDFAEDHIEARFERVKGVANSNVYGGQEREVQVLINPQALASRHLTILDLRQALVLRNQNISGGDFDEGKHRFLVRTLGQFTSLVQVENVIIARRDGIPVYVKDVAEVRLGYKRPAAIVRQKGDESIAINAQRDVGANVLDVMAGIRQAARELNEGILKSRGLRLEQVYDETDYISSAIGLVRQNIVVGGSLAIAILLLFFRSGRSTLVIALAIPISVIGTFLLVALLGRSLNVVSLAGMAFAVGMVVDNAIVVLENIYRRWQMGEGRLEAAHRGASEVWGAVLASTLTTLAVFIPVIFVREEAGQIFRDIAIAISCAVSLSLLVAITVIPTASAKILAHRTARIAQQANTPTTSKGAKDFGLTSLGRFVANGIAEFVGYLNGSVFLRLAVVLGLTSVAILLSWWMIPETEYLPQGNRNLIIAVLLMPPGYNLEEQESIGKMMEDDLRPRWEAEPGSPEAAKFAGPLIKHFFFVARGKSIFLGAISHDATQAAELVPVFQKVCAKIPGVIPIVRQTSLFERGLSAGRAIDIEIIGPELKRLVQLGGRIFGKARQIMPPTTQIRPIPSLDLSNPELHVVPRWEQAADLELSASEIGYSVDALVDGAYASDYWHEGDKIDLVIRGQDRCVQRTQDLEQVFIHSRAGRYIPLSAVADIRVSEGPEEIDRVERQRSITIQVRPPADMPLERALNLIQQHILHPMQESGQLGGLYRTNLSGTADKLKVTREALQWNFVLAIVITYLLMAALFESFLYPFVIMFSVPLAAVGGFGGIAILNLFVFQALDVLTMLGFVILVGIVVNNAILIVHQAINNMRDKNMHHHEAITESVRTRVRPIFMSAATSVFGMMPLVLFPGAGSELYRGLGAVIVGGLTVSTIFTLLLVPTLFSLVLDARFKLASLWRGTSIRSKRPEAPV